VNFKTIFAAAFALFVLTGCATHTTGRDFDVDRVSNIVDGVTTKSQIVNWFGEPTGRQQGSGHHDGYTYSFGSAKMKPETAIPIVGLFLGGMNAESKTLLVFFDKDGVVAEHLMSTSAF
jgi:outer membrane protein assembly factor BamE (lipoprotein component of BamABCDE complex)